jgi:hypothetical protein
VGSSVQLGYDALVASWRTLERSHGLRAREVAAGGPARALLCVDVPGQSGFADVALSAGVHGDEPAAPWALLSLVRDGLLDSRFGYRIWCCTNPSGFRLGTRTNAEGLDVNRSFSRDERGASTAEAGAIERANRGRRFALSLDLHEDFESEGFYCYEPVVDATAPFGRRVVAAMDEAGLPVEDLHDAFDLGYPREASHVRSIERGRVLPDIPAEVRAFAGLPYSMYLLWTQRAHRTMTLETPRARPWDERIAMHRVAVITALGVLAGA